MFTHQLMQATQAAGDSIESLLSVMSTTITQFLVPITCIMGAVMIAVGVVRFFTSREQGGAGGVTLVVGGLLFAATGFTVSWILSSTAETAPEATSPATPTPSATEPATPSFAPAPSPPAEPMDFSWLLVTLGILGALILVAVLVITITIAVSRARRSIDARRKQLEAEHASAARIEKAWQGFHDRHNELLRKILHSETDWDSLFFTPALTDPNVPTTYAMLRAMKLASTQRDAAGELPIDLPADVDLATLPYPRAVEAFALAWDTAERNARRIGQKGVPLAERKLIKQIRTLLDMAENSAASPNERNLAYRRAQNLIEGLQTVHIPERAIAQLEEQHQQMLTAGTTEQRSERS